MGVKGLRKKRKKVYGVGVNDADYVIRDVEVILKPNGTKTHITKWRCPYYDRWSSMLERCYSASFLRDWPSYSDCSVVPEWLSFMSFRAWMMEQEWEGKHLDKDLLVPNNKIYGPDTCVFIPQRVNGFITGNSSQTGELPLGTHFEKRGEVFQAVVFNRVGGKKFEKILLTSKCPVDCHMAWLADKLERATELASEQDDPRVAEALIDRYENYHKYFPQYVYGIPLEEYNQSSV